MVEDIDIINSMTTEQLRECLSEIVEIYPETASSLLKYSRIESAQDILDDLDDRIYEAIQRHTVDYEIPEDEFDLLCNELEDFKSLGDRCIENNDYKTGLAIYMELAQVAESLYNSTISDCVELSYMISNIYEATVNIVDDDKAVAEIKYEILALLKHWR